MMMMMMFLMKTQKTFCLLIVPDQFSKKLRVNKQFTNKYSRLDYQPLFGKGARAPPPNSRLDSWTYC